MVRSLNSLLLFPPRSNQISFGADLNWAQGSGGPPLNTKVDFGQFKGTLYQVELRLIKPSPPHD